MSSRTKVLPRHCGNAPLAQISAKTIRVEPRKPSQNGFEDSFHGSLRNESELQKKELARLQRTNEPLLDRLMAGAIGDKAYKQRVGKVKTQLALAKVDERA